MNFIDIINSKLQNNDHIFISFTDDNYIILCDILNDNNILHMYSWQPNIVELKLIFHDNIIKIYNDKVFVYYDIRNDTDSYDIISFEQLLRLEKLTEIKANLT
jgi:hypothetical protein